MTIDKSLIQSCVDHINTAVDVDPWAKELVAEMGKEILEQLNNSTQEVKNSNDAISRQAAIDALSLGKEILSRVLDEVDVVGTDREKYSFGLGLIEASINDIEKLPSIQPVDKDINVSCKDAISRRAAINKFCELLDTTEENPVVCIRQVLDTLPSVQPEIVPCGDCKHWICHDRRCGYWNHGVKPLEWCCHAERKENR